MADAISYDYELQSPSIDNTMGIMYLGVSVSATLYGASVVQTWYYYNHYDDSWILKLWVAAVFVCDTTHQCLIAHMMYEYLIVNFANPAALGRLVWSLIVEVLFNGLIGLFAQSFFAYRIYHLSKKNRYLICLVTSLVLAEFGLSLAFTIKGVRFKTFEELLSLEDLSRAVNAAAVAANSSIALAMVILLRKTKTGVRRGDSIINYLIIFSLNTGLLTSLCAILSLITITAFRGALIYTFFFFILGRIYTNSFLASLNMRHRLAHADGGIISSRASMRLTYIFDPTTKGTFSDAVPSQLSSLRR